MNKSVVLCGVGGQGTVLASKLLAAAAMGKGMPVMSAETIGMAQKGGSVFSFLRYGEGVISPMPARGTADVLIGFEPAEAVRMLPYLRKGGAVIVSSNPITPVTATLRGAGYDGSEMIAYLKRNVESLLVVDCAKACAEIGSPKVLNIVLLGAALRSGALGLTRGDIVGAMTARLKPQLLDMNLRALDYAPDER